MSAERGGLPINLDDLIRGPVVEDSRREFNKTWNQYIQRPVIRSICAFANDLQNLNGGYIVLGIEDHEGRPVLPPHGLDDQNLELVQKEIRGACQRLDPEYRPILSVEPFQGKMIVVIWVPGGDNRPYQAPAGEGRERA